MRRSVEISINGVVVCSVPNSDIEGGHDMSDAELLEKAREIARERGLLTGHTEDVVTTLISEN